MNTTVAGPTENLYMLSGRKDACVLWDIRVEYENIKEDENGAPIQTVCNLS